ncbi:hypothetical protein [Leptothoe spongobia]|uniref:Uncharacterized protein n=1 Tax=Leptothoe spongobia TAU-MAC 1115 TaxID=1967444 RepID=A0A947DN31_9CYAN|nr:hypothetical protein [Leptothoe spongobia]MBT9317916.1 hypothetical protein [Leptothoe spongobia TAU-MAC 1115]
MVGVVSYVHTINVGRGVKMGLQLFISLMLTLGICFVLPAVGLGIALGVLTLGAWSPLASISTLGKDCLLDFLLTFGAGDVGHGVVIICLTLSIVGGLFEMFTFYKYVYLK